MIPLVISIVFALAASVLLKYETLESTYILLLFAILTALYAIWDRLDDILKEMKK
jgi:protein-S-isoprenylcysteine O-methyltransferase Ste14